MRPAALRGSCLVSRAGQQTVQFPTPPAGAWALASARTRALTLTGCRLWPPDAPAPAGAVRTPAVAAVRASQQQSVSKPLVDPSGAVRRGVEMLLLEACRQAGPCAAGQSQHPPP